MDHTSEIKALRVRIASLLSEQRTLQAQVRSRREVAAYVEQMAAGWEREAQQAMCLDLVRLSQGAAFPMRAHVDEGNGLNIPSEAELGPLMVAMLGAKKVAGVLLGDIDTVPEGMPKAERLARLEAIAAELLELETEEERLITEAENAGEFIPRRRDARPEIVLALPDSPEPAQAVPAGEQGGDVFGGVMSTPYPR